jgi:hypothetical protein
MLNPVEPGGEIGSENVVGPSPDTTVITPNNVAPVAPAPLATAASAPVAVPAPASSDSVPTQSKKPSKATAVLIVISIVILLLAGAYYYAYVKYGGVRVGWAAYQFGPVNSAHISGDKKGHGASFVKPVEFSDPFNSPSPTDGLILKAYNRVNHTNQEIAGITLTEGSSPVHSTQFYKAYHTLFANPHDNRYNQALQPLKGATAFALNNAYSLNYQAVSEFKSANITDNAWLVKFSGVRTKDASSPAKISGSSLMVISKDSTYYFIQYADASTWNANQNTWNQVLNSLKVDQ